MPKGILHTVHPVYYTRLYRCLYVFIYLVDKVLVARVVRGDHGEDVPVILLHDVQHDGGLLLNGWTKLEKHGVVVLETRNTEPISK